MKKIFYILILVIFPLVSLAQVSEVTSLVSPAETPFGGVRLSTVPCSCTPPNLYILVYDYATLKVKKFVYVPGVSVLFSHFNLASSVYLLGTYEPRTKAGLCEMYDGTSCEVVPYDGMLGFRPGVGTSQ